MKHTIRHILTTLFPPSPISDEKALFVCGMSRSGTTLLSTIFDSHPEISMGYELIPPPLPPVGVLMGVLRNMPDTPPPKRTGREGKVIRLASEDDVELYFKRCSRSGILREEIGDALEKLRASGGKITKLPERVSFAWQLMESRKARTKTSLSGFKLNTPAFEQATMMFPHGVFLFTLRDPRDVVASHRKAGFYSSMEHVCRAWNSYLVEFERIMRYGLVQTIMYRYEDLVSDFEGRIKNVFELLPVGYDDAVMEFHRSKASIHESTHPNSENISTPLYTSSVGRWQDSLSGEDLAYIERTCRAGMLRHGYRVGK
ncbi:MAG: sulfotransferase [Thermodesulfovibrionales bacterium]|nr:sulfotransferase [Thermodesulfovibrionales bacterium]